MRAVVILAMMVFLCVGTVCAEEPMPEAGYGGELRLNLEEAVAMGLERNHRIQATEFAIERSRSQVKSARGRFLPRLSAGYNKTWLDNIKTAGQEDVDYLDQKQETWRVSLSQTLYAGRTILNTYQKAKIQEHSSRIEKEQEEQQLIRWIQEQFLLLLKAREDTRSLEQTVDRLMVSHEAAQSFVSHRLAPAVYVLQAQVELEEARQQLTQAKNMETIYKARLDALLNVDDRTKTIYTGDLSDIGLDQTFDLANCLSMAEENRGELQAIENNILVVGKEKSIAGGSKMPRVTLDATAIDRSRSYDQPGRDFLGRPVDRDQENRYWSVGVNVEWNFFTGGERYYQRQSMDYEMQRLEKIYDDTLSTIMTEVRSAYLRLQEAGDRVHASTSNLETAAEGYRMEQERLKRQIGTIQEYLNAQERLTRSEASKNQALLDYQRALADLYFAMGVRNEALN